LAVTRHLLTDASPAARPPIASASAVAEAVTWNASVVAHPDVVVAEARTVASLEVRRTPAFAHFGFSNAGFIAKSEAELFAHAVARLICGDAIVAATTQRFPVFRAEPVANDVVAGIETGAVAIQEAGFAFSIAQFGSFNAPFTTQLVPSWTLLMARHIRGYADAITIPFFC